ncbi:MAG: hypothetical protein QM708_04395 [Propioniciclava sp.]|uniref:hypothetical protein n=1 Tax=Propioniciclava sp. TaxID=2038686 RepID=UPI0039E64E5E
MRVRRGRRRRPSAPRSIRRHQTLDDADADLIIAFPIFIETDKLTEDAAWKALPAVAAGRAVVIDGDIASAYSLGTTRASKYAIEQLVPKIEAALK